MIKTITTEIVLIFRPYSIKLVLAKNVQWKSGHCKNCQGPLSVELPFNFSIRGGYIFREYISQLRMEMPNSFIKVERRKVFIVMNTHLLRVRSEIQFVSSKSALCLLLCSFSRKILCRSHCDSCKKVIRFLGVRCQDCRLVEAWGFNQQWPDCKTTHYLWIVMCIQSTTDLTVFLFCV